MESLKSLLLLLLSFLVFTLVIAEDVNGEKRVLVLKHSDVHGEVGGHSRRCSPSHKSKSSNTGTQNGAITTLEMRHQGRRYHHLNPSQQLLSDEARAQSIQSRAPATAEESAQVPLTSGVKLQTLNYVVTIELAAKKRTLIVDTGSDLTWIQCKPCSYCYSQQDPLFDPTLSPSYHPIPCSSPTCTTLPFSPSSSCATPSSTCAYALSYGDGSYTRGDLARDTLTIANATAEGFVFGCGRSNRGLFGGASGLVGLGRSSLSLVSQTSARFGGVFSYCLPSKAYDSSGSLTLGADYSVFRNETQLMFTRMVLNPRVRSFYMLNMTGMRVGGVGIAVASEGGVLIDSGTVISRLPPSVYRAVRGEFLRQFSAYPVAPGFSILDTCFNLTRYDEVNVPTLRMRFEGDVEVRVDVSGVFYFVKRDASQVCLALARLAYEDDLGIIGNYQQKNLRVVYDTKQSVVGFAEENCSYS
ncbi:Protein ASPARTIC PROTEASE IN GUARD CELL 2 [Acorus gramineus]|uniref:Protein ASPARTIC PROTEASE IN GUARD CELL 2 n=1 Tax=Acorus gramineus TaxID=55184 RepID=A0AAV9BKD5_ACOGR|nr:Protein ASPARTIC PROTEASE IN GUARD CELL 2 [Acorus gramineus]